MAYLHDAPTDEEYNALADRFGRLDAEWRALRRRMGALEVEIREVGPRYAAAMRAVSAGGGKEVQGGVA